MAGKSGVARLLERVRPKIVQELDINKFLPRLLRRGVISVPEEKEILSPQTPQQRTEVLLDILSDKDRNVFVEFCKSLEECAPQLLTLIILDNQDAPPTQEENPPTHALQLGFELALKERDAVLRENVQAIEERDQALRQVAQLKSELDSKHKKHNKEELKVSMENTNNSPGNNNNNQNNNNNNQRSMSKKSLLDQPTPFVVEADQAYEENGPNVVWETHHVALHKAPSFGFGIAVSGGRDSPHFASGDPSVAISDVLRGGPAEGKLQINDRILSVNGISFENVDHTVAINVLKESGNSVNMVVKRRVILPASTVERSNYPSKIILNKRNKKDDYGIILGCRFYVKEILPHSLASHERTLHEGDTVLKINNTPVEGLSLMEARRTLDKSKDKLILLVSPPPETTQPSQPSNATPHVDGRGQPWLNNSQIDFQPIRRVPPEDVNIYRPSVRSEEELYVKDPRAAQPLPPDPQGTLGRQQPVPPGAYPASQNTRYDGHYVLDNDPPPRNLGPAPTSRDDLDLHQPKRDVDPRDGYFSDWDGPRGRDHMDRGGRRERDYEDDVFPSPPRIHERYVDMRSDIGLEPRQVTFTKDRQTGLGLRLAGGNATGIYIASVQPGSEAEREGLVEGDNILVANEKEITGLTREEAVSYLTSLNGTVTLVVRYRKEDYDCIMASHEAGDSFYIRVHFNHVEDSPNKHSFQTGDIFLIKDTLFGGIGGSWLAIKVKDELEQGKKGTIPNSNTAEIIKSHQKGDGQKEAFPNRGKGSLFRKKSARRSKSLSKDHWEEVVFDEEDSANLETKFPAYERVVMQDPGFVRPVVIFGAVADIARDRLLAEYPDRFESPQIETDGEKKGKTAIIRLGAIREVVAKGKHCLLDVTPATVDRLQYGQYCPLVIFLQPEDRQAVKNVRTKWKGAGGGKNARKLQEDGEKLEKNYSHLFTGVIHHMGTDAWFPKLSEMIEAQQTEPCWMSHKLPQEDMNEEFMFPMSPRFSLAAGADSDLETPRPRDDLDLKPPTSKARLVRSSSDPSVNTHENIPGIPPYPSPPTYKNQRIPSHDSRLSSQEVSPRPYRDDEMMHPEDRYYPSYYTDQMNDPRSYAASRAHIDPYATLTPSERLRPRMEPDQFQDYFNPYRREDGGFHPSYPPPPPHQPWSRDYMGPPDNMSHSSDSYTKYVSSPQNKHDDTKLREKFAHLHAGGSDKGKSHDPYRFTRSTAHPVSSATVDRAKLSDLTAKYRRQDNQSKSKGVPPPPVSADPHKPSPVKKKEPPPVPVKTYSLKQRAAAGAEPDERKMRNYENSNRAYNYTDVNTSSTSAATPPLPPPPSAASLLGHQFPPSSAEQDQTYEYMSLRNAQISANSNNHNGNNSMIHPPVPPLPTTSSSSSSSYPFLQQQPPPPPQQQLPHQQQNQNNPPQQQRGFNNNSSSSNNLNSQQQHYPPPPHRHNIIPTSGSSGTLPRDGGMFDGKAFSNEVYMDHWDIERTKSSHDVRPMDAVRVGGGGGGLADGGKSEEYLTGTGYRRPRTDDEQLRDLQISRDRARSETRLAEFSQPPQHNNMFGSPGTSDPDHLYYSNKPGGRISLTDNRSSSGGGGGRGRFGRDPHRSAPEPHPSNHPSAFNTYQRAHHHRHQQPPPLQQVSSHGKPDPGHGVGGPPTSPVKTGASELRKPLVISPRKSKAPPPPLFSAIVSSLPPPPPPPVPSPLPLTYSKEQNKPNETLSIEKSTITTCETAFPLKEENGPAQSTNGPMVNGMAHSENEGGSDTPPTPDTVVGQPEDVRSPSGGGVGKDAAGVVADDEEGDEKHTVIATAKGIFNSKGGLLESPETGVSIWIPEGALGDEDQEIYFKVCQDNSLLPPLDTEKGETLLSPLVMCGPHGTTFHKPVHLRLPHSASSNPESWSFALKSSDAPTGETTEWQNVTLAGTEGVARGHVDQTSVSILVDHF